MAGEAHRADQDTEATYRVLMGELDKYAPGVQDEPERVLNNNTLFVYPATSAKQKEYNELKVRSFQISNVHAGTGANAGQARVRPELQRLLNFTRINLLDARLPLQGPFDVMFCRNVMIYFNPELQNRAVRLFYNSLSPLGYLALGLKESLLFTDMNIHFETVNSVTRIYRRMN